MSKLAASESRGRAPWPRVAPRFTAAALAGHSALGLAFGAVIYLVCLTGALSVFVDELKLVEQPTPVAGAAPRAGAVNRALAEVVGQSLPDSTLFVIAPVTPRQRLSVEAFDKGGERAWLSDATGTLTQARTRWTDFVAELHMTLTAPAPWGSLAVGLSGAALLALILGGVLAHPRIFRDAFRLRLSGSRRLREAELHNRLSVWGLPFHLVVTLTGAFFGLASLTAVVVGGLGYGGDMGAVYVPISGPRVKADARPLPLPDIEALARRAAGGRPGAQLFYVGVERPGTRGARITVEVTTPERLPRGEQVYFDATGREIGRSRFASGSLGLQVFSGAAQAHFGFFGGLPVRIAYGVLGGALTYVSATGVSIWLARRRDRGAPSPRLERAWQGWTWGVPAALALAAVLSRWVAPTVSFWSAAVVIQGLAQLRPPPTPPRPRPG